MKKLIFLTMVTICVHICVHCDVLAQSASKPDSFSVRVEAADARTLISKRYNIYLWGVEDVGGLGRNMILRGRLSLERLVNGQAVQCHVIAWTPDENPIARCSLSDNTDLAEAMIQKGFVSVDRLAIKESVHEDVYLQAEQSALAQNLGVWKSVGADEAAIDTDPIAPELFYVLFAFVILGLVLMILMGISSKRRFEKLNSYVKRSMAKFKARDEGMRQREKYVLAAMMQKEIQDNKDKTEAFIIINRDLLESIKAAKAKTILHRYQQSGEMIQKQPSLSRTVFDTNANRLDLLEPDMMQNIIDLYAGIAHEPEYVTLNKEIPLHEAINHVQQTILSAEKTLEPFDKIYSSLNIIMDETKRRKIYKSARSAAVSNMQ